MTGKLRLVFAAFPILILLTSAVTAVQHSPGGHVATDTTGLPSFPNAVGFAAKDVVSRHGHLSFTMGVFNDYYLDDSAGRVGYLYVQTAVDPAATSVFRRVPLNISIVIDRSGSMAGEKMDFAKKAANGIIDKLRPEDFVSVVIYDEFIDLIQPATAVRNKDSIKAKIAKIKPRNSTNLWGGADTGYQQVKQNYRANYVNRVLLISDGMITAGVKIASRIITGVQEYKDIDGISISTFGVGLDYNEYLMTAMAENGAGNFYFIDRADKMEAMFEQELNGLQNLIAQDAVLRVSVPKGVVIDAVYPFKYAAVNNEVVLRFRDLFSADIKALTLRFKVDPKADKALKFAARLTYVDAADNLPKTMLNETWLTAAPDNDSFARHFNRAVVEQAILFAANENMENAMQLADRGKYEAARKYAEANRLYLAANRRFVQGSRELQRMDSINKGYAENLGAVPNMTADSIKLMQKSNRTLSYEVRSKKRE